MLNRVYRVGLSIIKPVGFNCIGCTVSMVNHSHYDSIKIKKIPRIGNLTQVTNNENDPSEIMSHLSNVSCTETTGSLRLTHREAFYGNHLRHTVWPERFKLKFKTHT